MNWAAPFVLGLVPLSLLLVWWLFRPIRGAESASSFANAAPQNVALQLDVLLMRVWIRLPSALRDPPLFVV